MVISSKPEATPKKISNRRVKRKLSDINEDATNHARDNSKADDRNKIDPQTYNTPTSDSTNMNIDDDVGEITSIQPLIVDEKKNVEEIQDVDPKY